MEERIEPNDVEKDVPATKATTSNERTNDKNKKKRTGDNKRGEERDPKRQKDSVDCALHGKGCGHSTDNCYTLKKMREEHQRNKSSNNQQNGRDRDRGSRGKGSDMHAMVKGMISEESNAIIAKTCRKMMKEFKKRPRSHSDSDEEEFNEIVEMSNKMKKKLNVARDEDSESDYTA